MQLGLLLPIYLSTIFVREKLVCEMLEEEKKENKEILPTSFLFFLFKRLDSYTKTLTNPRTILKKQTY